MGRKNNKIKELQNITELAKTATDNIQSLNAVEETGIKPKIINLTGGFINGIDLGIGFLNNSKYFVAIMMLLLNLGSRYISMELSQFHEDFLSNVFVRRILVFTVVFVATRDIKVSLISTAVFIVLVSGLFHEDSKYCVLPSAKDPKKNITKEEYHYAQTVVDKFNKQKILEANKKANEQSNQVNMTNKHESEYSNDGRNDNRSEYSNDGRNDNRSELNNKQLKEKEIYAREIRQFF
jgi:hypothetical protein